MAANKNLNRLKVVLEEEEILLDVDLNDLVRFEELDKSVSWLCGPQK